MWGFRTADYVKLPNMKSHGAAVACLFLLALFGFSAGRNVLGCGEKYFVTVDGTRYLRVNAPGDEAILIYNNPDSEVAKLFAGVAVDDTLRKTGFRPTIVTSKTDFDKALVRGGFGLIIAGIADAQALLSSSTGADLRGVLPVVYKATGAQIKQAKAQYPVVLKAPVKSEAFLDVIEDALAHRPKVPVKLARAH